MVGSPPPTAEFLSKTVEELPERYIMKGGILDASPPVMDIPVIDVDLLSSLSNSDELDKLQSALQTWGCFQAVNHGIPNSFLDKVHEITKQFFALPMKEKQKYCRDVDDIEGYGNDMILYEDQILDWCDRLYLTVRPEDHQKLKFWPENPQTFREILHEYTEKTRLVNEVILKAMARSLKLEENCFLDQYAERATMYARFNFYPPCPRPDLVLGLKAHADGSAITIVLQDKEVEGLQFLKNGEWIRIRIIPEALLVNIGDQVEIMSNGVFKSPTHRVMTNSERERISLAMFCSADPDMEIKPVDELINETRPRLYKKVRNYPQTYFKYYQQGKRPIDEVKL